MAKEANWYLPSIEQYVTTEAGLTPADCGYPDIEAIPLPRAPKEFESFNPETQALEVDIVAKANSLSGPAHIAEARAQKRLEALLIRSGVPIPGGLLAEEAKARGVDVETLADIVVDKSKQFVKDEVKRQRNQGVKKDG